MLNEGIAQLRGEWTRMVDGENGRLWVPEDPESQLPLSSALLDLYEAVAVSDREGYPPNSPVTLHIREARDRVSRLRGDGLSDAQ